ncbi:hypothetical protein [uncultured Roseobacter sp.]|uniref:hypothetical protein n=1 Tax=uncultured Roseobacter sp. TaxID=114847 RepID=UPI002604D7F1|nr:hypothetical protein [uncultured Roseobacter sp.]
MKVSLKPGTEKQGLIMKREIHTVHVTVQMTEEEKAAAKAANILDQELFIIPWDAKNGNGIPTKVRELAQGLDQVGKFPNFLEASAFTTEVKDMLIKLKAALEAKMGEGEEEFEL